MSSGGVPPYGDSQTHQRLFLSPCLRSDDERPHSRAGGPSHARSSATQIKSALIELLGAES